jgi:hypothetical protein
MKTVESLEGQVLLLEAKCREKGSSTNPIEMDKDGSEVPIIGKEEKKVQRAAAPRASASSGGQAAENKVSELQKELREAKQALNDQQAEFEQLLAKQAEEMTAEFGRSSSRFHNIEENRTGLDDLIAHLKTENEQKSENCERLKRLIVQQDEVVAEQKKVMEAQAANTGFAMENMRKMLAEAQQKLKEDMTRIQSKDAELLTLRTSEKESKLRASMLEQENTTLLLQVQEMQNLVESLVKDQQLRAIATKELQDFKATYAQKMKDLQEDYIKVQDENEKLLKDVEQNMKSSWELKNQTTHLSRELESAMFSLNSKEKMVAKMSAELSELHEERYPCTGSDSTAGKTGIRCPSVQANGATARISSIGRQKINGHA